MPTPALTSRGVEPMDNRALKLVSRITGDAREDEMEGNLQGVGNILGNLKSMATDMGTEIKRQNDQLDLIQGKVSRNRAKELVATLLMSKLFYF